MRINTLSLDSLSVDSIRKAAALLKDGELVAIPTETVYGLAANALDEKAVAKIFEAKGRPADNPLIVHIAEPEQARTLSPDIPAAAEKLMKHFWPGALTLVLKAAPCVPKIVTAGLDTVAIRCPSHPIALAILREAGIPLAAPSANRSGLPSPTRAAHVLDDMDGRIAAVVDGGDCSVGVESTVLDMTCEPPCILRFGGVAKADIEQVIGMELPTFTHSGKPRSPGQKYRHYAPKTPLILISVPDINAGGYGNPPLQDTLVLCPEEYAGLFADTVTYGRMAEPESLARGLFAALREADTRNATLIAAICPDGEDYAAVRDRLTRAAVGRGDPAAPLP